MTTQARNPEFHFRHAANDNPFKYVPASKRSQRSLECKKFIESPSWFDNSLVGNVESLFQQPTPISQYSFQTRSVDPPSGLPSRSNELIKIEDSIDIDESTQSSSSSSSSSSSQINLPSPPPELPRLLIDERRHDARAPCIANMVIQLYNPSVGENTIPHFAPNIFALRSVQENPNGMGAICNIITALDKFNQQRQ